jgi:hypothetical protein
MLHSTKLNQLLQFPVIHPANLKKKDFHYPYRAPEAHKAGQKRTPEEVELEIKSMEENMEKMVLVNVEYVHKTIIQVDNISLILFFFSFLNIYDQHNLFNWIIKLITVYHLTFPGLSRPLFVALRVKKSISK